MHGLRPNSWMIARFLLLLALLPAPLCAQWLGHAGDPQHTGLAPVKSLPLDRIVWSMSVDETSPTEPILIHYGSPLATPQNTIVVPVRGSGGQYCIDAVRGSDGTLLWDVMTDFVNAPSDGNWVPNFSPTLTPSGALYYQGIGGTVYRVADANATSVSPERISFLPDYMANKAAYDASVFISTPITSDTAGNIYFGYEVSGTAPGGLTSGIARIAPNGTAAYVAASAITGPAGVTGLRLGTNSAPALSLDGSKVYLGLQGMTGDSQGSDYLAAIDSATLAPLHNVALTGYIDDAGTTSPTVGPDGRVYFGTLPGYHFRGTLGNFSADLSQSFTPGSFGWDETVSIVPRSMVPSYTGTSTYLIFSKYNDYKEAGGTGINKLAILDPNDTQIDPVTGQPVMKEILTIAGVTPDPTLPFVREWCINAAVVDPFTHSILANSEDGMLYRWDLWTNTFSEAIELFAEGAREAYTPTMLGPDGTTYAINRAVLFAIVPEPSSAALLAAGALLLARRRVGQAHRLPGCDFIPGKRCACPTAGTRSHRI